jgi:hypothetical protein
MQIHSDGKRTKAVIAPIIDSKKEEERFKKLRAKKKQRKKEKRKKREARKR